MKRRLFTILSALSLVLCLTMAGVWRWQEFRMVSGIVVTQWSMRLGPNMRIQWLNGYTVIYWSIPLADRLLGLPGKGYSEHDFDFGSYQSTWLASPIFGFPAGTLLGRTINVADWFLMALFGILPCVWLILRVLRRQMPLGTIPCAKCGYDIRASTGKCPECGAAIPPKAAL